MFPYLFSVGSEANVKQCVLFVLGRPAVYLLFISIIRNETCTFRISYNIFTCVVTFFFANVTNYPLDFKDSPILLVFSKLNQICESPVNGSIRAKSFFICRNSSLVITSDIL